MLVKSQVKKKSNYQKFSNVQKITFGFCILFFLGLLSYFSIDEWLRLKGFKKTEFLEDPISYSKSIPINFLKSISSLNDIPVIAIDINFKNWKKLETKRLEALALGALIKDERDYVKASLRYKDQVTKVKLRLKGDHTDHLLGNKWSFRIKVSDEDTIFGLRRFSIQNPRTRVFQSEPVFYEMLKDFGIITPRYFFVKTFVNGENIGVMAIEEHFSKEMIEYNHRKESVFIGIDESRKYSFVDYFNLLYDSNFKTFQHNKIWKSKELFEDFETAIGLLRSFLSDDLNTEKIFDEVLMGRFLAIVDVWGAGHGLNENTRFYYNPIIARLEPVGFDSNIGEDSGFYGNKILNKLIKSSTIRLVYADTIQKIKSKLNDPDYINKLKSIDSNFETQLRGEFFLKPPPVSSKFKKFRARIKEIESSWLDSPIVIGSYEKCDTKPFYGWAVDLRKPNSKVQFQYKNKIGKVETAYADQSVLKFHKLGITNLGLDTDKHGFILSEHIDDLVHNCSNVESSLKKSIKKTNKTNKDVTYHSLIDVLVYSQNNKSVIEIINTTQHPVNIDSIIKDGEILKINNNQIPIVVRPGKKILILLDKNYDLYNFNNIEVISTFIDKNKEYVTRAIKYAAPLSKSPVPDSNVIEQLRLHSFLKLDKKNKLLNVSKGTWDVTDTIIVPAGFTLAIKEGTRLNFNPNSGIISYGILSFNGNLNEPVVLDASIQDRYWNGIVVIGKHEKEVSILQNVMIRNIKNYNHNKWRQTGGIVFFRSDLKVNNLTIKNANSEDAINIIQSNFDIKNLTIENAVSDAIDIDFSNGSISLSKFSDIGFSGGGDAIDVSGSIVNLEDILITNIDDKAISIGERSNVSASKIEIKDSNIGITSKDSSQVFISNSLLSEIRIAGLMAYIKKLEYGPSKIIAENILFSNTASKAKVQKDSHIRLNGNIISTENIDVENLYNNKKIPGIIN